MDLPALTEHAVTIAGWAVPVGVVLRYSPRVAHAVLWLVAGITHIFARGERSRRALAVLGEVEGRAVRVGHDLGCKQSATNLQKRRVRCIPRRIPLVIAEICQSSPFRICIWLHPACNQVNRRV